ncbi:hypothetical protein [Phenylobacterium ferrooxidans]|uniref:Uncharacterized protein n=1 Tax=Phenylobacterium ferrooxidans TaxID=2982689 RepID=A0ABW6CI41_9CAUL
MFQVLWGDDEHTAAEGIYVRLMKARKWLLGSAAIALILAHGFVEPEAVDALLKVVRTPLWAMKQTAFLGLVYMLAQFMLLCLPLVNTYHFVLEERLGARQESDLEQLRAFIETLQQTADEWTIGNRGMGMPRLSNSVHLGTEELEARLASVQHRIDMARQREARLISSDLRKVRAVKYTEVVVDLLRVGMPIVFGCYAALALWLSGVF